MVYLKNLHSGEIHQYTVVIMWVPGHSGIQQKETTDGLTKEGAGPDLSVRSSSYNYPWADLIQNNKLDMKKETDGMESLWKVWDQLITSGRTNR